MRLVLSALACLSLTACGRYEEFSLPKLEPVQGQVNFSWKLHPQAVISRGADGEWDDVDALNPSIVRYGGRYLNLYSGYDGRAWHTGVATSSDGVSWRKQGRVLSPDASTWESDYIAANGSVIVWRGQLLHWYQAGKPVPQIGLSRSSDAKQWSKHATPVLERGPYGSWDERGVADPYVVEFDGTLYMYYLGQDRARRQRLGIARSTDGEHWQKLRSNPILELGEPGAFDETGLGEPAVWQSHGAYWMLYTARDRKEYRRLGLAQSSDGVHWTRVTKRPVLEGSEDWNRAVVCDPTVEVAGDEVRVWFGGGNRPQPAENLNGQIGFGVLQLSIATLQK